MQKIMLTLMFCSVVVMANNEQKNVYDQESILTKTLKEVKTFKRKKNQEIKGLKGELRLLKKKLNASKLQLKKEKSFTKKEIKKLQKEKNQLKNQFKVSQKKVLNYEKAQLKANKQLKADKKIIKDLHFMIKQKNEIEMDEYALGRYYFNL